MENNNFVDILKKYRELIWPKLNEYIEASLIFRKYCQVDEKYKDLVEFQKKLILEYPGRKGKYFRPALLVSTALAMGAKMKKTILPAVAMQLSEEWILIHDDIEDESEERRGLKTIQNIYGEALAINAGDALQVIMWKVISDINNKNIEEEFYHLLCRTTFGQTVDLKWNVENKTDISDDDVFLILESKTCYYTVSGPMRLGALVAGATEEQLEIIYIFGRYLGRVFQIIDDVLDLTSDFSGLKKQQYNDLYEGKRTIPLAHLLRSVSLSEKAVIKNILAKKRKDKSKG
jgi:geranylgeranyl diphosphate synthase, type II